MAWHSWKACFKAIPWVMGGVALAIGCSHAWDDLEPLSSGSGHGGHESSGDEGAAESSSTGAGATLDVPASVAACVSTFFLDTDACEFSVGPGEMSVDQTGSVGDSPDDSFVRFDFTDMLSGKTIDSVTLELVVASLLSGAGDHSGEVWQVSEFTLNSLDVMLPMKIGSTPVGLDKGSLAAGKPIQWTLPTTLVSPKTSLYLGIYPKSPAGIAYWNVNGASPPRLIIKYH